MHRIVTAAIVGATVLAACSGSAAADPTSLTSPTTPDPTPPITVRPPHASAARVLMPFDACDDLVDWAVEHAIDLVGPYGLNGGGYVPYAVRDLDVITTTAAAESAGAALQNLAAPEVIGTNLQELGVDEPDLVKTDGRRIVVMTGSTLQVVLVDNDDLTLAGSIDLGFWSNDLFLDGDRVVAIASNNFGIVPLFEGVADGIAPYQSPLVTVVEIDITDPTDPELKRSLQIDGRYVSSRMVDGAIRLVVSSQPTGFAWEGPEGTGLRAEREAEEKNRELLRNSTADNWLPYVVVTDHDGIDVTVVEGTLVDCNRTHRPDEFSGLTTLSLVTLDVDELAIEDATAVFADGDIVYSSGDATYVATSRWINPFVWDRGEQPEDTNTMIHKFTLEPRSAEYQASGSVPGYMLSQWSMSEWQGDLRVASTDSPQWWDTPESDSVVTVLRDNGDELETIGSVDGLGRGERIYAVRFIEDRGYVVTFRQVDPLYVIDLSDPRRPTVEGELKIHGYSAYLHPVSDDLLLGVGQDADHNGRVTGLQASLFDVADPQAPERTDQFTMGDASSELEWDHHAFLFNPADGLTVIPFQRWDDKGARAGALVLEVTAAGIREIGIVSHNTKANRGWEMPVRRSLLIDGRLVTVSEAGVMMSAADTLDTLDWVEF
ncbi:MAG: beta-propeller domain-containing protein [Acidobacteria bacterium]|nr:beta-propeller domain-containing protein [Acidobacteriota bacterium]